MADKFKKTAVFETIAKDGLSGPAGKWQNALQGVTGAVGPLNIALAAAVAGTVAVAAAFVKGTQATIRIAEEQAKLGDQMAKDARRIGLTANQMAAYSFAADKAGASAAGVRNSFRFLARAATEAADETLEYLEVFNRLEIEVTDGEGRIRELNELFLEGVDSLNKVTSSTERLGLAQQLFGRGATELAVVLEEGREALEKQMKEYERFNELSPQLAKMSEDYVDAHRDMKEAMQGLRNELAESMLPIMIVVISAAADLTAKITDFVDEAGKDSRIAKLGALSRALLKVATVMAPGLGSRVFFAGLSEGLDRAHEAVKGYLRTLAERLEKQKKDRELAEELAEAERKRLRAIKERAKMAEQILADEKRELEHQERQIQLMAESSRERVSGLTDEAPITEKIRLDVEATQIAYTMMPESVRLIAEKMREVDEETAEFRRMMVTLPVDFAGEWAVAMVRAAREFKSFAEASRRVVRSFVDFVIEEMARMAAKRLAASITGAIVGFVTGGPGGAIVGAGVGGGSGPEGLPLGSPGASGAAPRSAAESTAEGVSQAPSQNLILNIQVVGSGRAQGFETTRGILDAARELGYVG